MNIRLENDSVRISEIVWEPGVPRESYTRQTNQLVVFLEDCTYCRIDAMTDEQVIRFRKSGDVLWHQKGEEAPVLINAGDKPYRTLLVEFKA
jgi:hypothetical protein